MRNFRPIAWVVAIASTLVIVGLVSGFDRLWSNPVVVLFMFGFNVQAMFAGWGSPALGWMIGIPIFVVTILMLLAFGAWLFNWVRDIIASYRRKKGGGRK